MWLFVFVLCFKFFFFFKRKPAYGMRISDWSSDVCSSDLHRSEPHARIEHWLRHLPGDGVRAMCSWERFCAFAREPERRTVAGDATVSVEGASYEVEPELAGGTVTLLWGLFDQQLFVEHDGKRHGPYEPSRGAVPLYRYRKYPKRDRKSVVSGKSVSVRVDLGGRRIIKKKKTK